MNVLDHAELKREVAGRITRLQSLMAEHDLGAAVIVGGGAAGHMGAARYFSNVQLWSGRCFIVVGRDDPEPYALIWSSYQAEWAKQMATTTRIESDRDPLERMVQLASDYAGDNKRIGFVNLNKTLSISEYNKLRKLLGDYEPIEISDKVNAMRQIKTPFELEAQRLTGKILAEGMNVFQEALKPGRRCWDVCAEAERYVKAQGCFWGWSKLSLDGRPYTIPTALDRTFQHDDIIDFELVYSGPLGYFCEMTTVYSFGPMPDDYMRLYEGYVAAQQAAAATARPGVPIGRIAEVTDQTFRDMGFAVAGKPRPDCHSIGTDGSDGPNSQLTPDAVLKENMTLSLHPGTVMEGERGFLLSDNFWVTPEGGVRLSNHTQQYREVRV